MILLPLSWRCRGNPFPGSLYLKFLIVAQSLIVAWRPGKSRELPFSERFGMFWSVIVAWSRKYSRENLQTSKTLQG